jgi:hypothetical protein
MTARFMKRSSVIGHHLNCYRPLWSLLRSFFTARYKFNLPPVINLIYRPFYVRFLQILCGRDVHNHFENYFCLQLFFCLIIV